jgi:cob(I)alamin adenosyltransferase
MSNRLSKIITRTGDKGTTGLASGARLPKDAPRIEAIGEVDELNSQIGVLLAEELPQDVRGCFVRVQHELFDLGGELSIPDHPCMTGAHITRLEQQVETWNQDLPPLKDFILPGGCRAASLCHVARAVCRRAERRVVTLAQVETLSPLVLQYLNRLSDLLFVACRVINRAAEQHDVPWLPSQEIE